jgi:hypothetical protein
MIKEQEVKDFYVNCLEKISDVIMREEDLSLDEIYNVQNAFLTISFLVIRAQRKEDVVSFSIRVRVRV